MLLRSKTMTGEENKEDEDQPVLACCSKCDASGPLGQMCYCSDDNHGFFVEDLRGGKEEEEMMEDESSGRFSDHPDADDSAADVDANYAAPDDVPAAAEDESSGRFSDDHIGISSTWYVDQ